MDKNRLNSITKVMEDLHDRVNDIYESILEENFDKATESVTKMEISIKHLKQNLKVDEI
tara:strand:+ start:1027 stop:1203 length:177 start_codon:yes stop_codon:yes gene_type:complete